MRGRARPSGVQDSRPRDVLFEMQADRLPARSVTTRGLTPFEGRLPFWRGKQWAGGRAGAPRWGGGGGGAHQRQQGAGAVRAVQAHFHVGLREPPHPRQRALGGGTHGTSGTATWDTCPGRLPAAAPRRISLKACQCINTGPRRPTATMTVQTRCTAQRLAGAARRKSAVERPQLPVLLHSLQRLLQPGRGDYWEGTTGTCATGLSVYGAGLGCSGRPGCGKCVGK